MNTMNVKCVLDSLPAVRSLVARAMPGSHPGDG